MSFSPAELCYFFCYFVKMRYCLVCLLLLLFSCQVLPVKKIGKLLCKAQTEEVQGDNDDSSGDDLPGSIGFNNDLILQHSSFDIAGNNAYVEKSVRATIHNVEALPLTMADRIPSPPPEC